MQTRTVTIPRKRVHEGMGFNAVEVTLVWRCPVCDGPRGPVVPGLSYDGSRALSVDTWDNPCGHVDKYSAVRDEVRAMAALEEARMESLEQTEGEA